MNDDVPRGEFVTIDELRIRFERDFARQRAEVHAQIDATFDQLQREATLQFVILEREVNGDTKH